MKKILIASTAMLSLFALTTSNVALASDNRAMHKERVAHAMTAAKVAMVRLDYHADKFCEVRCERYNMDLIIATRAMQTLENYAALALGNKPLGTVDLDRIKHQITAANAAIARLDYYADRVATKYQPRVSTDVGILDRSLKVLGNYAQLAPVA